MHADCRAIGGKIALHVCSTYTNRDEKASDGARIGIERMNPFEIIPQVQNTLCPLEVEHVALRRVTD
jgi:hypothetical protein